MDELVSVFIFLFAVIDPIGTVPVFLAVTNGFDEKQKRIIAIRAVLTSAAVLLFFVMVGEIILDAINVPLSAFEIAGGIVLFLFAMTMIFGESKPDEEIKMIKSEKETAIFPLAIPSIASPGAMLAVVLLTKNEEHTLLEQAETSLVLLLVLGIVLLLLLLSKYVHRVIGDGGSSIISRVMGMILAAVAINNILDGVKQFYEL